MAEPPSLQQEDGAGLTGISLILFPSLSIPNTASAPLLLTPMPIPIPTEQLTDILTLRRRVAVFILFVLFCPIFLQGCQDPSLRHRRPSVLQLLGEMGACC